MTKIYTDSIEPASGTTLTIGESGQNTVLPGNDLRANVVQDLGGNAIFTSNGSGVLSGLNSAFGSPIALIQSQTCSGQSSLEFTTGITSTYKALMFSCISMRTSDDSYSHLQFQVSDDGGSTYGKLATTGFWRSYRNSTNVYGPSTDNTVTQYNSTNFISMCEAMGADASEAAHVELLIYNASGTTYTKGFRATVAMEGSTGTSYKHGFTGGWLDTTDNIDAIKWQYSSGNLASGKIKLYGFK
mgnify:CR=1 FL=1